MKKEIKAASKKVSEAINVNAKKKSLAVDNKTKSLPKKSTVKGKTPEK